MECRSGSLLDCDVSYELRSSQHSRIIEKELKEAEKRMAREVKILLLGAGEVRSSDLGLTRRVGLI